MSENVKMSIDIYRYTHMYTVMYLCDHLYMHLCVRVAYDIFIVQKKKDVCVNCVSACIFIYTSTPSSISLVEDEISF